MKTFLAATAFAIGSLVGLSVSTAAQGEAAAVPLATAAGCYVEVTKLMGDPPNGIGELGAAIRALDARLRPQVEEVNELKAEIGRLEARRQREAQGAQAAGGSEGFADEAPQPAPALGPDSTDVRLAQAQAELETKHNQLKRDYAEQQGALVGPVQARVSERAQVFAAAQGCGELKMARAPDLAGLTSAGARNVTGEFVAWYLANPPA